MRVNNLETLKRLRRKNLIDDDEFIVLMNQLEQSTSLSNNGVNPASVKESRVNPQRIKAAGRNVHNILICFSLMIIFRLLIAYLVKLKGESEVEGIVQIFSIVEGLLFGVPSVSCSLSGTGNGRIGSIRIVALRLEWGTA